MYPLVIILLLMGIIVTSAWMISQAYPRQTSQEKRKQNQEIKAGPEPALGEPDGEGASHD